MKRNRGLRTIMPFIYALSLISCISLSHVPDANDPLNKGRKYLKANEYQEAITIFSELIIEEPKPEYHYYRGLAYMGLDNYQRALEDFDKLIELAPNLESAYFNRGMVFRNLGNPRRAIDDFTKEIELYVKGSVQDKGLLAVTFFQRGSAYHEIYEIQRAKADFKKALDLGYKEAQKYLD